MWWIYFDASALVKRYSPETGSVVVDEVFRLVPLDRLICSTLCITEVASILVRKRNDGRLTRAQYNQAMSEFNNEVIAPENFSAAQINDDLLLSSLSLISKHNINAADAAILRSAINLRDALQPTGEALMLWASDKRLVRAAKAERITVFDPAVETIAQLHQLLGVSDQTTQS